MAETSAEKSSSRKGCKKKGQRVYCKLCRRSHSKRKAQDHVHGMLHHKELETVQGKDSSHECQACRVSCMGLYEYGKHISTAQHRANLKNIILKNVKPVSLFKTLSPQTINQILERNKKLKREKKAKAKKKNKMKKKLIQKQAAMLQREGQPHKLASKPMKREQNKKINIRVNKEAQQKGSVNVVQNKENKVQRPSYQGEAPQLRREPPGRTCPSKVAPAISKQSNLKMTQNTDQRLLVRDGLSNREKDSRIGLDSPVSLRQSTSKTVPTEPNLNISHKVHIAHESKTKGGTKAGLKPAQNIFHSKSRLSWMEMYIGTKMKNQDKMKGMPRFGIKFGRPPTHQENSTRLQDMDLPLSEGFHWESILNSPSVPQLSLSPQPQDTTDTTDSHRDTRSDSQLQEPVAAQGDQNNHTATLVSVKQDPKQKDDTGGLRDNGANKRKNCMDDGISNKESSQRKKTTKTNKEMAETSAEKSSSRKGCSKKGQDFYCKLCRRSYSKRKAQDHVHGMLHHKELETVQGKDSSHECQACRVSCMGLYEYAKHISTAQHQANLKNIILKNVKPVSLFKTLSPQTIDQILERNKKLKREKKAKAKKKNKTKNKPIQKQAAMLQREGQPHKLASKPMKREQNKKINVRVNKEAQQKGSVNVVQNKENKVQRPSCQGEAPQLRREPPGRTWHQACVRDQSTQSIQQMRYGANFSVNNQHINVKAEPSHTRPVETRPHNNTTQDDASTELPQQMTWPAVCQYDFYSNRDSNAGDPITDNFSNHGNFIFDHDKNKCTRTSQPELEGPHCSTNPDPADMSVSAAAIRDVDVSGMLKQIRRALGVREPCRADREAKRQSSETGSQVADGSTTQQAESKNQEPPKAGTTPVQSPQVNNCASAEHLGGCPSKVAPAISKQSDLKMTQNTDQRLLVRDGLSNREKDSRIGLDSPVSLRQCTSKTVPTEPNLNICRKVRIAHESKTKGGTKAGLKPAQNIFHAKSRLSWMEIHNGAKMKNQDNMKGMPRFGIKFVRPPSLQENSTRLQDMDLPLSEGFHWESIPNSPSVPQSLSPQPQDTTDTTDSHRDTRSDSPLQEPVAAQGDGSNHTQSDSQLQEPVVEQDDQNNHTATLVLVKQEPKQKDATGGLRDNVANKRKNCMDDGISNKESSQRKKTTKTNKDHNQMDQLLAVSLREDKLSHLLQDVDISLVQARNVLQAAYTEVQRLLLLRQQFTAEVNSLRTTRIEILQGMQEGYSGSYNVTEKAVTSSANPAATIQPGNSPLPSSRASAMSSNHQTSATTSAPSPTLSLSAKPVKQEICHSATTGQASQPVSLIPDGRHVAPNQPLPLFPSNLLTPLLPGPSDLPTATSTHAALAASTSASTLLFPESSAMEREPAMERLQDTVLTVRLEEDHRHLVERESEKETRGKISRKQIKARDIATEISVPAKDSKASAPASDKGINESDDSVKLIQTSDVVIDIDDSDNEDSTQLITGDPNHRDPPQMSASVPPSQQNDTDRKVQLPLPVKDENIHAESEDEEPSLGAFVSHTGPVHGLQVYKSLLYTCSGDNTARAYSLTSMECKAVFEGHTNKVNCLLVSSLLNLPARLYTGSSDETIRCYSIKSLRCVGQISLPDSVLCLHTAWNILYAGLANGSVCSFDLKTLKHLDVLECHGPRGVSCLGTAQEGARRVLLVGSYDSTISVRDAKSGLLLRSLQGHSKTVLCMKVVNDLVFSGSSDTSVHAHNIHTGELVRIYKGHSNAVTSIVILGKVMVTACLDQLIRVYELQVYRGHSDMVMCMAIHKSVIYTGCFDGSVQALKLNLMENYRCRWQNCSLIFGIAEHLLQHLVGDHSNLNLQTVKCHWRSCSAFFATQQEIQQKLPDHMQNHVENDSKVES
ncbi:uncharacterized protein znf106b isoform X2 [Echeneis naucrates]|uniref:uncharacterized protein znf106b isoform X2 n=1 Tax=Echeneis naucrates TaxID=173247 RepID=UPI001113E1C0|nr:uncharacterized protein LOC115037787 isoform X2 [Echeneis naucrates]